eukprot:TRINITY_DN69374_c0_g1_i1.p1 TRINITY_DN69374_c0_g1~~TRINITY_DN69374_c0_g1_i1.p1  ORF type:complete len:612 (+),score=135.33 TRINITY_DN69374_c0_g1_i1:204-2039(+)
MASPQTEVAAVDESVALDRDDGSSYSESYSSSDDVSIYTDEDGEDGEDQLDDQMEDKDALVHWWIRKQLHRCLSKLGQLPNAEPFLEPFPWEELEFHDYLEVVEDPIDLSTCGERLENGEYDDEDGFCDPEVFWGEVTKVWDNCKDYYEGDEDAEPFQMADAMARDATAIEEDFYENLERFENSVANVDGAMGQMAAVADVAAGHMEDTLREGAVVADELMRNLAGWWWGGNGDAQAPPDKSEPAVDSEPIYLMERRIVKVVAEAPVGKGKIIMRFADGVPLEKEDQDAFIEETIHTMSEALEVDMDEIEIHWDQVFKEPKQDQTRASSDSLGIWDTLPISYRVRLQVLADLEDLVEHFDANDLKKAFRVLGEFVHVDVEPLTISKASRRPLRDHFFDMVLDLCNFDCLNDLDEIEREVTEAMKALVPVVTEIDVEEENNAKAVEFPEAHKKVPLARLMGPKTLQSHARQSSRRTVSSRGASVRDTPEMSPSCTPRRTVQSNDGASLRSGSRASKASGSSGRRSLGTRFRIDPERLAALMSVNTSSDDDEIKTKTSARSSTVGKRLSTVPKPDLNKLKSMFRPRDPNAPKRAPRVGDSGGTTPSGAAAVPG